MKRKAGVWLLSILTLICIGGAPQRLIAQDGERLYEENCASCHAAPSDMRTPPRSALGTFTANSIYHALSEGLMRVQGQSLSESQKIAVAQYLSGRSYTSERTEQLTQCAFPMPERDLTIASNWNGWGNDLENSRSQDSAGSNISTASVNTLALSWAFGFEEGSNARAQPSIINGVMYFGSNSGRVYALDLATGCAFWTFLATSEVRGSLSISYSDVLGRTLLVGADISNRVFVLDAVTGERIWHADVDPFPLARSTGSPIVAANKVFVPVSSIEVAVAGNPDYECCQFRGNLAAFDINTGEKLWHTYIMEAAQLVGTNRVERRIFAPSGAPIWDTPTVDLKRNRVYAGTGQNYTRPTSTTSDAVIAFDMDTGAMEWVQQTTSNDAFTMACSMGTDHPNCPDAGPDLDIGASVMAVSLSTGKDIVLAGNKGAVIFAMDPDDNGKVMWQTRLGRGGALGGVHWGMSFVGDTAFVPISDRSTGADGASDARPGLHAIDMKTGAQLWYSQAPDRCNLGERACMNAYSAAASASADLIVAGALNGFLFAHDQRTGELVWEYNTVQEFATVNGVAAMGGAIDSVGPVFSGDYLVVNSGYATFGQIPGNALLVFKLSP